MWLAIVCAIVAVALTAGIATVRRTGRAARRLAALAVELDPGGYQVTSRRLLAAVERVERSVEHHQALIERAATEEQRLHRSLESLPEGVIVADGGAHIVFRNAAATSVGGARHAGALVEQAVHRLISVGLTSHVAEEQLELRGPPRKVLRLRAIPVHGPEPTSAGALIVIEDVSERVRLEAARTDFVANLSHELKSPVGAIALLAETVAAEDDPALVQRLSERIVMEAHRVSRLVDDLLELSRIEHEGLGFERVAIASLFREAAARVHALAEHRGIEVCVHEPAADLEVDGDRRQLVSAVGNLADNGVKYALRGGKLEMAADVSVDGYVDLVVRDDGIGIPASDLDRIFERFYRVDRARSRETGGTGLGLAIVRHVAVNHRGAVLVESEEGVGSTFRLRLPLRLSTEQSHPPTAEER